MEVRGVARAKCRVIPSCSWDIEEEVEEDEREAGEGC
jgi:hypothetical protein